MKVVIYRPRLNRIVTVGGNGATHPAHRRALARVGCRRGSRDATTSKGVTVQDAHQQVMRTATV